MSDPADVTRRVAVASPDWVGSAAADPHGSHLVVLASGSEVFSSPRDVSRPSGAGFSIACATLEGSGWVRVGARTHAVRRGDVFLLPPDVGHAYGTSQLPWSILWMDIAGDDVLDLFRAAGASTDSPVVSPTEFPRFVFTVGEVLNCLDREGGGAGAIEAAGQAWRALSVLAADRLRPVHADEVSRAMAWIAEHIDRQLSVADVARVVGLSTSGLAARFRRAVGGGVIEYQTSLRMDLARKMLVGSDASIAEIARATGYADPYYFSRVFRRTHDASPSAFRNRPRP